MQIEANIIDVVNRQMFYGTVQVEDLRIRSLKRTADFKTGHPCIMPGFIDAHVHIESSMLVPTEFARLAVRHGTVATVSDPHEIANVLGVTGVEYMLDNATKTPLKIFFGAPSCVPATSFETAGATIGSAQIAEMLQRDDIYYLAEMMNFPGVLNRDDEVMTKIQAAKTIGKPVDGHAPGLIGEEAQRYIEAGITTDHECTTEQEARDKLKYRMKIAIREGSAAKNFDALFPLIDAFPGEVMLCSDDKHPDDLLEGHINLLVKRALDRGADFWNVLTAACVTPVMHYTLPVGLLRAGDAADFVIVDAPDTLEVLVNYINGQCVYGPGREVGDMSGEILKYERPTIVNAFDRGRIDESDLHLEIPDSASMLNVIEAIDGSLVTGKKQMTTTSIPDLDQDVLKIAVVNRYTESPPAVAVIHGFGLKTGALASSVAHDSHNIVVVGTSDRDMVTAVNKVIEQKGGITAVENGSTHILPLPIAGIISDMPGEEVADRYTQIDAFAKHALQCRLTAPFMTLSFMALLVIPKLKLSDRGLFDVSRFEFTTHYEKI